MFSITQEMLSQLIDDAKAGYPLEVCGLIAGVDGRALDLWPLRNVDPTPRVRYALDPYEQRTAFETIEGRGWELLGIYHSHPGGPPHPSASDIAESFYPEAVYVILSLARRDQPDVSAWRIAEGRAEPVEWRVLPE